MPWPGIDPSNGVFGDECAPAGTPPVAADGAPGRAGPCLHSPSMAAKPCGFQAIECGKADIMAS